MPNSGLKTPPPRYYIIGTGTDVGKTRVAAAIISTMTTRSTKVLPFKPALSGYKEANNDATILINASSLDLTDDEIIAHRYDEPLAPGIAHSTAQFVNPENIEISIAPLRAATELLSRLERTHQPNCTIIEGAGGLEVPMPGGTWQPVWVQQLASNCIVVADAGLGTINHTVLTIRAAKQYGLAPVAFAFSNVTGTREVDDPSISTNAQIIAAATSTPFLGTLEHQCGAWAPPRHNWFDPLVWSNVFGEHSGS